MELFLLNLALRFLPKCDHVECLESIEAVIQWCFVTYLF